MVLAITIGVFAGYFLIAALVYRAALKVLILKDEKKNPDRYKTEADYFRWAEELSTDAGILGMFWPLGLVILLTDVMGPATIKTDRLKRIRAEAELEKVKAQARELGLEFPDV